MSPLTARVFTLPARLAAKDDPALISGDERLLAEVADTLSAEVAALTARLDAARREPGRGGQAALERDLEIHRLTSRLGTLRRFGVDLCLGRMVPADGEPVHIGRIGLTDASGRHLLVDWRSPAAEPFFGATHANPMGLASRRRYRWSGRRIVDYWDEVFTPDGLAGNAALDDQSAFIASLGDSRSPRMRDVLGTIQADQDAVIRAGSRGALVVDGGPGTGKTVVALHRAAYLLHAEPRITHGGGGVLFVGPHPAYLAYVDDVLPSLGEDGVRICTLRDMAPEGADAGAETDPVVARLKESARLADAIEAAVRHYERPPTVEVPVETPWASLTAGAAEWAEAFDAVEPGTPHNEGRAEAWEALLAILADAVDEEEDAPRRLVLRVLARDEGLGRAFARAWPLLDPAGVVADLWSVPAYLRMCAPWLADDEVRRLQRDEPRAWTIEDLPYLDAARQRIGDPDAARRARRRAALMAAEREQREMVRDHLIAADDSEMAVMSMLRGQDLENTLVDEAALPAADPDLLAGPFAHVIVDEAQELTDAQWRMLLRRCPSRSLTIVGDRAQARRGFAETWRQRLGRVGVRHVRVAPLSVNYRTPAEIMSEAEPVIRAAVPDANVPVSIRSTGVPVRHGGVGELSAVLEGWLAAHDDGIACVIGDPTFAATSRVRSLTPELSKGLEFDLVVLVDPDALGDDVAGAVDRYVAMTRATGELVVLTPAAGSRPSRAR